MRGWAILSFASAALAACNGYDELCHRSYSEITFVGTHNSPFAGVLPVHNQFTSPTQQLELGVRVLQAETHGKDGAIHLCHADCSKLDVGPLGDYLVEIAAWLEDHQDEVVTLFLTNVDKVPAHQLDGIFESSGLKDTSFHPKGILEKDQWPTLQQMISDRRRFLVFMDHIDDPNGADYILDETTYFWKTASSFSDRGFPACEMHQPMDRNASQLMGIVNHVLYHEIAGEVVPNIGAADSVNSREFIQHHVDVCNNRHSTSPNVILLDWIDIGDGMNMQRSLNGIAIEDGL